MNIQIEKDLEIRIEKYLDVYIDIKIRTKMLDIRCKM